MQPLPHWVLLTFSLLLAALPAPPAAARCLAPATERPTIGLVLAGGGARGSAHIGVIRVLEEMNVPIDCVGGTSMGSLVAGLYATGMSADELEAVILDIDWDDLFVDDTARADQPFRRKRDDNLALFGPKLGIGRDASLVKSGVIAGQKISFLFESLVKERTQAEDFDELPIPYRAVAADIATARKVVLSHGDLAVAMRSSMSVPGVFEPVPHQGHLLVDGGIVDNVPVDVLRDMGADILIVVDVGGGLTAREDLNSSFAVIGQLINMLVDGNSQAQLASLTGRDVLITPPLGTEVGSADFGKSARGIEIGFAQADRQRAQLAALSLPASDYAAHRANIAGRLHPSPVIQFVHIDNQSRFDDSVIRDRLTIREGAPLDVTALDADIREIYALGFMNLVRYEVVEENGQTGIVVHAGQDGRGTDLIEWGLDYYGGADTSELNVRAGYLNTAIDRYGSEMRVITQLGQDPGVFAYLYKYLNPPLKLYLEPRLTAEQRTLTIFDDDGHALERTEVTQYGGAVAIGREFGRVAALSVGVSRFSGSAEVEVGPPDQDDYDFDGGELFAGFSFDRLDDRYFPGRGGYGRIDYRSAEDWLGADDDYDQLQIDTFLARTFGRHSLLGGLRYYETLSGEAPIYALFRAGGFGRLSGYAANELVGQNFSMVMGGYRYHFAGSGLLPGYLGFTVEYGQMADRASDLYDDGLFNGSLYLGYRSPVGPLYLGVGAGEGGEHQYFLRIGNVFGTSTIGR